MRFHKLVVFTVGFFTQGAACAAINERSSPSKTAKFILTQLCYLKKKIKMKADLKLVLSFESPVMFMNLVAKQRIVGLSSGYRKLQGFLLRKL